MHDEEAKNEAELARNDKLSDAVGSLTTDNAELVEERLGRLRDERG